MCFVNDYDWYAEVSEEVTEVLTKPCRCMECGRQQPVGATMHTIHQQEYEVCQACENDECECPNKDDRDHACACEKPAYGETVDYRCCEDCNKFLQAVEDAEVAAGCSRHESRPSLERMMVEISEGGADEAKKYFVMATRRYPELNRSGYLRWLWRRMFP